MTSKKTKSGSYSKGFTTSLRDQFLKNQLRENKRKFSKPFTLNLLCLTYNVNNKKPTQSLEPVLDIVSQFGKENKQQIIFNNPKKKKTKGKKEKKDQEILIDFGENSKTKKQIHSNETQKQQWEEQDLNKRKKKDPNLPKEGQVQENLNKPLDRNDPLKNRIDLIIFGLQEVDTTAPALFSNDEHKANQWKTVLEESLSTLRDSYKKVASKQMAGILLFVYARSRLRRQITNVDLSEHASGIFGMLPNKGGVAIKMDLYDSTIVFVNSHLACDMKHMERRNQDWATISENLNFNWITNYDLNAQANNKILQTRHSPNSNKKENELENEMKSRKSKKDHEIGKKKRKIRQMKKSKLTQSKTQPQIETNEETSGKGKQEQERERERERERQIQTQKQKQRQKEKENEKRKKLSLYPTNSKMKISNADILFWMGDLNYRLENISRTEVLEMIEKKELNSLLKYDQLREQMKFGYVFKGFKESVVNFPPTYKFDPGTITQYDTSEKKRTPAWTDRILWNCNENHAVRPRGYCSHPKFTVSDHKPVVGFFELTLLKIDPDLQFQYKKKLTKELDKAENESKPDASVSTNQIDFLDCRYNIIKKGSFTLKNKGSGLVQFRFMPKNNTGQISEPWIRVTPSRGMINPAGEMEIFVQVQINHDTIGELYQKSKSKYEIEDILVLHLENSKDHFIVVRASYEKSCFGMSLNSLVSLKNPIKKRATNNKGSGNGNRNVKKNVSSFIPKELWKLVNYINENCLDYPGIFMQQGFSKENQKIRDILDNDVDFAFDGSPLSVSETILHFLNSIAVSVIPVQFYKICLESVKSKRDCFEIIKQLPIIHQNVFIYLISFLKQLLKYGKKNKLEKDSIALIFSTVILRSPTKQISSKKDRKDKIKRKQFLLNFL
ncbi:hypothetical protein M0812_02885 [Anaeramoeba flamelloides]|uniref:Rho-GAP domain-containing protein n=1 Tax=Anaeramoeba flamelloides TaxID=1746091 RepID=A0AAV7YQZ9_9EUKA|nr:hypothetical protein M0812_02885 [Anaeramoeba flamelloides]